MFHAPQIDPDVPLLLVINGASGHNDADSKREAIEAALKAAGRTGELLFARPKEISGVAHQAADLAALFSVPSIQPRSAAAPPRRPA